MFAQHVTEIATCLNRVISKDYRSNGFPNSVISQNHMSLSQCGVTKCEPVTTD